jgi:4,5-dihydroxyphthalate decarboxylase
MIALTVGCGNYDRTRPLADGRVALGRYRLEPEFLSPQELFARAVNDAPFDVSELSASSHLVQFDHGSEKYVALPIFLARSFRYDAIYIRPDRGIEGPRDLEGKRVGVPEYQLTMALWLRGMLQDEHGVDFHKLSYVTGGVHAPGRRERVALALPPSIDCRSAPSGASLNDLLRSGEIDALFSPYPPDAFVKGEAGIRRLFAAPAEAERSYFRRTGLFPIMHFVGLRKDWAERAPGLAADLFAAFDEARGLALDELKAMLRLPALPIMLPWLAEAIEMTFATLGADPWPYGIEHNRNALRTLCRYAYEQHLTERLLTVEELFPMPVGG